MVKIRKMQEIDIPRIVYLEETFLGETLGQELLATELNSNVANFYVATVNDIVVGYIGRYAYLGEAEILNFVVDENYQRQGIGQMLFDHVIDEIKDLEKISLEVRASNVKGINFYQKNGFKEVNRRKAYYKNGEDALLLIKECK